MAHNMIWSRRAHTWEDPRGVVDLRNTLKRQRGGFDREMEQPKRVRWGGAAPPQRRQQREPQRDDREKAKMEFETVMNFVKKMRIPGKYHFERFIFGQDGGRGNMRNILLKLEGLFRTNNPIRARVNSLLNGYREAVWTRTPVEFFTSALKKDPFANSTGGSIRLPPGCRPTKKQMTMIGCGLRMIMTRDHGVIQLPRSNSPAPECIIMWDGTDTFHYMVDSIYSFVVTEYANAAIKFLMCAVLGPDCPRDTQWEIPVMQYSTPEGSIIKISTWSNFVGGFGRMLKNYPDGIMMAFDRGGSPGEMFVNGLCLSECSAAVTSAMIHALSVITHGTMGWSVAVARENGEENEKEKEKETENQDLTLSDVSSVSSVSSSASSSSSSASSSSEEEGEVKEIPEADLPDEPMVEVYGDASEKIDESAAAEVEAALMECDWDDSWHLDALK